MSRVRVHNLTISLDGFGSGDPQSYDEPFGHGAHIMDWFKKTRSFNAMIGRTPPGGAAGAEEARSMPGWARAMKDQASARHHRQAAIHAIGQGDRGGGGATPDIKERED